MATIDFDVIEFGTEERIIRPVGPIAREEIVFGKTPDGGIVAATCKPAENGFVQDDTGTPGLYYEVASGQKTGFACRSYYIFYAIERYTDPKLKLVVAPYTLVRQLMVLSQQKGTKAPGDLEKGLDLAIRFERSQDKDRRWDYRMWTLGEKPLTPAEKRMVKKHYVKLDKAAITSSKEELNAILKECKPHDPVWEPGNSPSMYILDFLTADIADLATADKE